MLLNSGQLCTSLDGVSNCQDPDATIGSHVSVVLRHLEQAGRLKHPSFSISES
jgi:hypothetical protein